MELNGQALALTEIATVALDGEAVEISSLAQPRIVASRKVVEEIIARDAVVYGVTTGFGKLSDVRIPREALSELQLNLGRRQWRSRATRTSGTQFDRGRRSVSRGRTNGKR